jgi:preprotein translocase subunit SecB
MAPKYYFDEMVPNIDMRAVSKVAPYLNLVNIYILEAKTESDPSTRSPKGAELDYKYDSEIISEDNNNLYIKCNFLILAHRKQVKEKILLKIEATFVLKYTFEDGIKLESQDIENFARINPLYNAWPYWREFVQSITTRMGFPTLTIPLLKIEMTKSGTDATKKAKSRTPKKKTLIPTAT